MTRPFPAVKPLCLLRAFPRHVRTSLRCSWYSRRGNDACRAMARTRSSGAVVAHVSDMTDQWAEMRTQIEERLVRLHEMIAEARALKEALGTKGTQREIFLLPPIVVRNSATSQEMTSRLEDPPFNREVSVLNSARSPETALRRSPPGRRTNPRLRRGRPPRPRP
jgi:hypothetical protein